MIIVLLLTAALALARHNLRSGRGDRRGATRVSLFVLGALIASWVIGARHSLQILEEIDLFLTFLALALLNAGILWLSYVALEPYVRRYCPEILMSWTRLLGGRFRDPRVGRDVLVGVVAGVVIAFMRLAFYLLPPLIGNPPPMPRGIGLQFLIGTSSSVSTLLRMVPNALQNGMLTTLVFVVMLMLVKRAWLAAVIAGLMFGFLVTGEMGTDYLLANIGFAIAVTAVYMVTLLYFGLLAQTMAFLINFILGQGALTADFSKLYATTSIWLLLLVAGIALSGFYASRAGQPLLGTFLEAERGT